MVNLTTCILLNSLRYRTLLKLKARRFDTYLAGDATATFERRGPDGRYFSAQDMYDTALASLHGEFATVVSTAAVQMVLRSDGGSAE
jgi:hypothetical protein